MRGTLSTIKPSCIAVVPDPQYYAAYPWWVGLSSANWIVNNKANYNIEMALITGDLLNSGPNSTGEKNQSYNIWHTLDASLRCLKCTGNHDYNMATAQQVDRDSAAWMGVTFSGDLAWVGGTMEENRLENSYYIAQLSGGNVLFISLEFCPRTAALEWAQSVITANPGIQTVILTHAYLFNDGTVYSNSGQLYEPKAYAQDGNTGTVIESTLVIPNPQVKLIVSGHTIGPGIARRVSYRSDGSKYIALMTNFQNDPVDLRIDFHAHVSLVYFDWANDTIRHEVIEASSGYPGNGANAKNMRRYYNGLPESHVNSPTFLIQNAGIR